MPTLITGEAAGELVTENALEYQQGLGAAIN